jgi:iron complex outermembrane receptor protein
MSAHAMADSLKQIDVPAGDLVTALQSLARQADVSVVYQAQQLAGLRTSGAKGNFTPQQAVTRLLQGTKLHVRTDMATGAMLIEPPPSTPLTSSSDIPPRERLQLAQVGDGDISQSAAVGSGPAAAEEGSRRSELTEIVVTAQKREERAQDVPISIVAVTADELEKRQITGIDDLQSIVPGLQLHKQGQTNAIYLRGVANLAGNSPLVGVYLDEADVTAGAAQLDVDTYDLQRVEVLRGPQGTLYGEGSMGGTIRFITNNPALTRFEAKADVAGLLDY